MKQYPVSYIGPTIWNLLLNECKRSAILLHPRFVLFTKLMILGCCSIQNSELKILPCLYFVRSLCLSKLQKYFICHFVIYGIFIFFNLF